MDAAVHELGRRVNDLTRDRARMQADPRQHGRGRARRRRPGHGCSWSTSAARRLLKLDREATGRPYLEVLRHPGIADQIGRTLGGHVGREPGAEPGAGSQPHARRARRAGGGRGPGRRPRAARRHRPQDRGSDSPRLRRQRLARAPHAAHRDQGLRRGPHRRSRRRGCRAHRFLDIIHRHATRMERLVKDLLRLARLDAGQEAVELAPCDVQAIASGVVADLEPVVQEKRQRVTIAVPPEARIAGGRPGEAARHPAQPDRERGELHARGRRDRARHAPDRRTVRDRR